MGEEGSRGDMQALSLSSLPLASSWPQPQVGKKGALGDIRTAFHLQLAGLLVQREFLQIHGTSCCGGESAKEKQKEEKSESSPGK